MRRGSEKLARFNAFTKNQILELVGNYGPIDILWLDGSWLLTGTGWDLGMPEAVEEARKMQPNLISVDREAKNGYMDVGTPEQTVPSEPLDYPWESCITMSNSWGYHYDDSYKSARELIRLIVDVVSKGGNLALNVGPMPDGRLPRPALERMEIIGKWLEKNGDAIYGTRTSSPWKLGKWRFTRGKDGRVFAIRLWDDGEGFARHVLLDVAKGQGDVVRIVHLATGSELSFSKTQGDAGNPAGVTVEFPEGFARDEYADAFLVEYGHKEM